MDGEKKKACLSNMTICTQRHSGGKKNKQKNPQKPKKQQPRKECSSGLLKVPRFVKLIPGTLIWCQTGGGSKIYTHRGEVFHSLAVCSSAPAPPQHVFRNWPKVLILLSRAVQVKKERGPPDKQQLNGNSWLGTVGGFARGPGRKREQVGVAEGEGSFGRRVGLSETDLGQNPNLGCRGNFGGHDSPHLPARLPLFPNKGIRVRIKPARAWGSVKQSA